MTLPSEGRKLSIQELESIQIALSDVGIRAIHPDRMEAFAQNLVEQLKRNSNEPGNN